MKQPIFQEIEGPDGRIGLSVIPTPEYQSLFMQAGIMAFHSAPDTRDGIYEQFTQDLVDLWRSTVGEGDRFDTIFHQMAAHEAAILRDGVNQAFALPPEPGDQIN